MPFTRVTFINGTSAPAEARLHVYPPNGGPEVWSPPDTTPPVGAGPGQTNSYADLSGSVIERVGIPTGNGNVRVNPPGGAVVELYQQADISTQPGEEVEEATVSIWEPLNAGPTGSVAAVIRVDSNTTRTETAPLGPPPPPPPPP